MGIEVATNFQQLDRTWPLRGDGVGEHQQHLRLLKTLLKSMFAGSGGDGYSSAINTTEDEFNYCEGLTSKVQDQINNAKVNIPRVGAIYKYAGLVANISPNYQQCDGTNGTPNLTNMFIRGTSTQAEILTTGGFSDQITLIHDHTAVHGHTNTVVVAGDHFHGFNGSTGTNTAIERPPVGNGLSSTDVFPTDLNGIHAHVATIDSASVATSNDGVSGTDKNIPIFYTLMFIQRMT